MNLEDILNQLEVGELSQLALTERVNEELTEECKQALVTHINMGLTVLHKRFVLKRESVTLALQPDRFVYVLDSKFAESNTKSTEPVKYIKDLDDPFTDRVMQIEAVSDDLGNDVPLNNASRVEALKTTNFKTLVLPPRPKNGIQFKHLLDNSETLSVIYRANHRPLGLMDLTYPANMVEIDLPDTHLEPLLYYIASRVMNPIGMNETFHAGNNYAAKYEAACQQIQHEGYELSEPGQGQNFYQNGWV